MTIHVNGSPRAIGDDTTLASLLTELGQAGRKGIAAAVNDAVIPRPSWPAHILCDNDRILIIQATQGG